MYWKDRIPRSSSTSPSVTPNELLEILLEHTYGYYVLPAEPYDEVYPNIYLGDSTTALCIHLLKRLGITHVLNAAWGRQRNLGLVNTSESFYRNAQIQFMGIEALDMTAFPLYPHFRSAANFIEMAVDQMGGKILVHCGEGISRSSTLVIAYLMIKKNMTVSEAIRTVVKHRNILPNHGFLLQLCQLNDELFRSSSNNNNMTQVINKTFDDTKIEKQPQQIEQSAMQQQPQQQSMESKPPINNEYKYIHNGNYSRSPTPNHHSSLSSSTSGSSSTPNSLYSRSPTPNIGYFTPTPVYNNNHGPIRRSMTPTPSTYKYKSVDDYENRFNNENNAIHYNYFNSIKPIENRILMQRRMDFRRAQSVERPNYVTRGSSYLNKISSSSATAHNKPPISFLSRSQFNLPATNNFGHHHNNNFKANPSLMTTYLINRPLPSISR